MTTGNSGTDGTFTGFLKDMRLQIFGFESSMLGDAGEHFGADFNVVVESPDVVRIAGPLQDDVRGTLKGLGRPADT
jgi:hypothetical protein